MMSTPVGLMTGVVVFDRIHERLSRQRQSLPILAGKLRSAKGLLLGPFVHPPRKVAKTWLITRKSAFSLGLKLAMHNLYLGEAGGRLFAISRPRRRLRH
jgi:hypothetical protein